MAFKDGIEEIKSIKCKEFMECNICKNTVDNKTYTIKEMMFGYRHEFDYFQCSQCLCLQISDIPEDMSIYYPDNYYSYSHIDNNHKIKNYLISKRDRYCILKKGIIGKYLSYFFPNPDLSFFSNLKLSNYSKVLDVGCGSGKLLNSFYNAGIKKTLGIDPFNKKDVTYKNGLSILIKTIYEVEGKWDLIILNHSFEHMKNPLEIMKKVAGLLSPDGYCVIGIPVISSYAWKKYGVNWVQIDAPRHFFIHSTKSMEILSRQSGLQLVNAYYNSTGFQFWGSEQYLNNIALLNEKSYFINKSNSMFSAEDLYFFDNKAKKLNEKGMGDQAIYIFNKQS